VVLSGMNEEAHIEENISIANTAHPNSLTADEAKRIKRVKKTYRKLMKVGCTGCSYCMPCPSGVNIPASFEFYNSAHMFNDHKMAKQLYLLFQGGVIGEPTLASMCEHCGECEQACPQRLPIQQELENVAREFEGRWLKQTVWLYKKFMAFKRWRDFRKANKSVSA